jgi:hypothetical protein
MNKVLNKEAKVTAILNKCKNSNDMELDVEMFNKRIEMPDANEFIIQAAELVGVKVVYVGV